MSKNEYSIIDNYTLENDIGEGNFGKVKLCIFKKTGEKFAIKILNKKRIETMMKDKIFKENKIITKFNHLNIISVFEIIEDLSNIYIIMEYCQNGELFDYIISHQKLTEEECSIFFYQLIKGVEHIHSLNFAHRDLKPENILLTEQNILKIIDFGLSHEFHEESDLLNTKCGSPSYASPEILIGEPYDGFKSDIWSCGIILFAMATGYLPFEGDNNKILFKNILECKPEIPDFLGSEIKYLLSKILTKNPKERITIKEIKKSDFYLKVKKLFNKKYKNCLNLNIYKNKRAGENKNEKIIEKELNNNKDEVSPFNKNNNSKNKKYLKKEKIHKNIFKFIKSKNTIINFRNKIMNINLNFNKNIELLHTNNNNHIINTDMNTLISNKISYNNTENNHIKDNNLNNNEKKINSHSKRNKLQFRRRNKINNMTPYLKTSETSPTSSKLPSFGQGTASSEKIFNLKSNNLNTNSKNNINNNNDINKGNAKSNNQRLNSENNLNLINKYKYYLISKKTIPKDKKTNKKEIIQANTRNTGINKNSLRSIKTHNSNSKIPFYNINTNYNCMTTTNNSGRANNENNQLKILFSYSNNFNKKLIQKKKLISQLSSSSTKTRNNKILKSFKSTKSVNSTNNKTSKEKSKNKYIIQNYKINNKLFKEEKNYIKTSSTTMKSLKSKNNDKNNHTYNLKKNNLYNNIIKRHSSNYASIHQKKHSKKNINLCINDINSIKKNSSIVYLNQQKINHIKSQKGKPINTNINSKYFNKKKRYESSKIIKSIYSNNNNTCSHTNTNSKNSKTNSKEKKFNNRDNISHKCLYSENASEGRCNNKNKKENDIVLIRIKNILEKRNKQYFTSKNSFNSFKNIHRKYYSSLNSRKVSSERIIKNINYSGLDGHKSGNSGNKYKYNNKNIQKFIHTNLYLKTLKNTPSDFKTLYNKSLFYKVCK